MKYIVFGAGNNATKVIEKLHQMMFNIEFVVDNDEIKQGNKIQGIEIKSPSVLDSIKCDDYKIIVSVVDMYKKQEIGKILAGKGFIQNRDYYFESDLFMMKDTMPGRVSGYIDLPNQYRTIKSFDPASRLIILESQKKIYRGVNQNFANKYLEVYKKCKKSGILENFIINTTVSDKKIGDYSIVLEHEFVEPVTYCFEWSPQMIFDYVRFMLDLMLKLDENGLGLTDGHVLNATIYKGKFIFLDFGAISIGRTKSNVCIEFINTHIIPLILFGRNQIDKAYMFLKNPGIEFNLKDVNGYLDLNESMMIQQLYNVALLVNENNGIVGFIQMCKEITEYFEKDFWDTMWYGYQNDEWSWSKDLKKWSEKMINAISMIRKVKPDTIIDIAGNMGWYGAYLHDELKYSIVMDNDYACINDLWKRCKNKNFENVYPVYMSICSPTLPYYRDDAIDKLGIKEWRKGANDRLKTDMVIALAIIHHLVFRQQLTFSEIINQFSFFCDRYLLIEYISIEDKYIKDFKKEGFEWYTKENFVEELKNNFIIISESISTPKETRTLYLCKKKNVD